MTQPPSWKKTPQPAVSKVTKIESFGRLWQVRGVRSTTCSFPEMSANRTSPRSTFVSAAKRPSCEYDEQVRPTRARRLCSSQKSMRSAGATDRVDTRETIGKVT